MRLHGSGEQKARHRKGTAHKSDKAMLADAAVGERLLAADKHIGGTTGERAAGKTGVLGTRLVTVLADRPGSSGIEHGQVGNGARLDLNLVEAQDLTRLDGHELDHATHAHLARVDQLGEHERQRSLEADHAEGRKLELAGLLPRGVGSVIGDDSVDGTVDDALANGLGVRLGTQRRVALDSTACAACTYMWGVAQDAKKHFGDRIDVVEYMYNTPENISRIKKMGVKQLPSLYLNGELKYSSLIPNLDDLIRQIEEAL